MDGTVRARHTPKWVYWLLWWKIDASELQRQVSSYATLTVAESARGIGFLLAMLAAVTAAGRGGLAFPLIADHRELLFYAGALESLVFLVLGWLVLRGRRWAALGLMVFYTFDRIAGHSIAQSQASYQDHIVFWALVAPLAWAIWMHAFYVAYWVERRRAELGLGRQ